MVLLGLQGAMMVAPELAASAASTVTSQAVQAAAALQPIAVAGATQAAATLADKGPQVAAAAKSAVAQAASSAAATAAEQVPIDLCILRATFMCGSTICRDGA